MKDYGFGADLGGTTVKLGLFRTSGELLEKWEIPTALADGGRHILPDIAAAIREKMADKGLGEEDVQGIGIGVPGAVRPDGVVDRCVNLGWGVVDVKGELSAITGVRVEVANDANIAALGEAWMGAGKGFRDLVMVTLGTGVGGGIVLDGKIRNGAHGAAGEMGHIRVDETETETCNCGNQGCLEQYASATGVVRMARRALAKAGQSSRMASVDPLTAKDVFDLAKDGDPLALSVVRDVCGRLGAAIATVCDVVDPEVVLIGGGVSRAGQIILDELQEGFHKGVFHACRNTEIRLASLGNDAGIYGGVRLVLD